VDGRSIFGHEFGHELLSVHASEGCTAACSASATCANSSCAGERGHYGSRDRLRGGSATSGDTARAIAVLTVQRREAGVPVITELPRKPIRVHLPCWPEPQ
jgi:hypothetical protein